IIDKTGKINTAIIYAIFNDPQIIATIYKYATGSILLHASSAIDYLQIAYNESIYSKLQEIMTPIFRRFVKNKLENSHLAELRDFLLPMLMNGQVSVD
ncbi:MAG: hypothetical protein LBN20_03430, partial [Endomicrobium sp.]|nr:hypothetical protein [Endomicrobium sp.]